MRKLLAGGLLAFTAAACAPAARPAGPAMTPAPPPPTADFLTAGTIMQVTLTQPLGTAHSEVGNAFTATVALPIVAQNGERIVPAGATVHGTVTGLTEASAGQPAAIRLDFERLTFEGRTYPFRAAVVSTDMEIDDGDRAPRAAEAAVVGAAAGGMLGAIIRGDLAGTLTGAALGAGVGTIVSLGTDRSHATIPAGSRMAIQVTDHIRMR